MAFCTRGRPFGQRDTSAAWSWLAWVVECHRTGKTYHAVKLIGKYLLDRTCGCVLPLSVITGPAVDCNRSYSRRSTGAGTFRAISQRTAPAIDEATPPGSRLAGQLPGQSVLGRVGQQLGVLLLHHDVIR